MVEFTINSSVSESTGYAPFKLSGGYMPSMIKEFRNARGVKSFATTELQNLADVRCARCNNRGQPPGASRSIRPTSADERNH